MSVTISRLEDDRHVARIERPDGHRHHPEDGDRSTPC
jgi:hypothetical protein